MKKYKILLGLLIIVLSFILSSCDPGNIKLKNDYLMDIEKVELIHYDNNDQKEFGSWVPNHKKDLVAFVNEKASVLKTLDNDLILYFSEQLSQSVFLETYYCFDSPKGDCIRITYKNGDFMILWCVEKSYAGYVGTYTSDGAVKDFIGSFCNRRDYSALVDLILTDKIPTTSEIPTGGKTGDGSLS